ncbi:MAG: ATP synthase F1 subunit gamma [Chloroflexota bacterium]
MPNLREIRSHIQSVSNIAQVTKAIAAVSTAKMRRLEARERSTRPFADVSWAVLGQVAVAATGLGENVFFAGHRPVERLAMLLFSSDRGLAGAYDDNIVRRAHEYLAGQALPAEIVTVGAVGREAMLRLGHPIHADLALDDRAQLDDLTHVAQLLMEGYQRGAFHEVVIAYTQYTQPARLQPQVRRLLPIATERVEPRQYLFEPSPEELVLALLPRVVRFQIYAAFLESQAAEQAARTAAMHSATQNADELTQHLRLAYNKTRQQAITSELLDIMGGVQGQGVSA